MLKLSPGTRQLTTIVSPEAAALHDAVNYPSDGNKGIPDISIPLYTIEYGKITVPIVLRYSTSNAKVDHSVAPNVGFGWVLDVGGSIYRVIKGKPDESAVWYQADSDTYFDQMGSSQDMTPPTPCARPTPSPTTAW